MERLSIVPFVHQRAWFAASDGLVLLDVEDATGASVRLADGSTTTWMTVPREGGRAHFLADLGAYKVGKSFGAAVWATGFACIPNARVSLIGLEYDVCEPEFSYLCEFLLSDKGMNLKATSVQNRPRDGKMWMDLENGARYEARSWERKDTLKGKEIDCLTGDAPIWMGDFSFRPIKDVKPGDMVIGWGNQRRTRNGVTPKTIRKGLLRTRVLATHQKRDRVIRLTLASGAVINCTPTHRWLSDPTNKKFPVPKIGRTLCRVIALPKLRPAEEDFDAGWLAGIYDDEGNRNQICQSLDANPEVFARIEDKLTTLGFAHSRVSSGRTGVEWLGGRQAALNFLHTTRSTRFLRHADEYILGGRCVTDRDEIVSIEDVGEQDVYCLQTDAETYIAHGYVSHNCYVYCESFMLPGIECFTGFSQNLRARQGYAVFATTPDRPWVKELHERGHGADPEWFCTCGIPAEVNPYTFDANAKARDATMMTREKFQIHYLGTLGDFVGRVFNFQRGQRQFTATTHPMLFEDGITDRAHFRLPDGWEVVGGADTGTFYTAGFIAFSPRGDAFVLDELPNYRYVAGSPERDEELSIPEWAGRLRALAERLGARNAYWADANSQFKGELRNYGIAVLPNKATREQRTEIAREYFQHDRIWLAPWLTVIPFELENAAWPEEASAAGKYERVKDRDHSLDWVEHILSKRPRGQVVSTSPGSGRWADQFRAKQPRGNVHIGAQ